MTASGIKAKMLGGFFSSKGLLTGNVVDFYWWRCGKIIKSIACLLRVGYTKCNRVARCSCGVGDQAETCAQLFYVKEWFYGFEKAIDFWWAIG